MSDLISPLLHRPRSASTATLMSLRVGDRTPRYALSVRFSAEPMARLGALLEQERARLLALGAPASMMHSYSLGGLLRDLVDAQLAAREKAAGTPALPAAPPDPAAPALSPGRSTDAPLRASVVRTPDAGAGPRQAPSRPAGRTSEPAPSQGKGKAAPPVRPARSSSAPSPSARGRERSHDEGPRATPTARHGPRRGARAQAGEPAASEPPIAQLRAAISQAVKQGSSLRALADGARVPYASVRDISARTRDFIPEVHRPAVLRQLRQLGVLP